MTNIKEQLLAYDVGGVGMKSYLAWDDDVAGPRPGVLVCPEWWGLDDYIRGRTRQLAQLGYVALGVDMYGDGSTADNPDDAGSAMNAVLADMDTGRARLEAARDALASQPQTDASRIAAIGYCFGGAVALHGARWGMDLRAVVSFHGALDSMHKPGPGEVKAKLLICHGAADMLVPDDSVQAFKSEMDEAGADYEFIAYEGAQHGFSNPAATARGEKYGLPLGYDADTDARSWDAMRALFDRVL